MKWKAGLITGCLAVMFARMFAHGTGLVNRQTKLPLKPINEILNLSTAQWENLSEDAFKKCILKILL